ncbi:MAG: PaaI family thioesterase [Oscillospiraceae bacterium]|nr:PaaI family thioesterase [Oscillospiraceae bacterium]
MDQQQDMEQALSTFIERLGREAPDTFSGQIRPKLVSCDAAKKSLVFSLETQAWMRNPGGAVHGGVIAEIISMAVNALAWYCAGQRHNPAISIQLSYPRPGLIGPEIFVRATAIHAGRTIAYTEAAAWQQDREDRPFAVGTGVHYIAMALDED